MKYCNYFVLNLEFTIHYTNIDTCGLHQMRNLLFVYEIFLLEEASITTNQTFFEFSNTQVQQVHLPVSSFKAVCSEVVFKR